MIRKAVKYFLLAFVGIMSVFSFSDKTEAAPIFDYPKTTIASEDEIIPNKYNFIATFNEAKTEVTTFGPARWRTLTDPSGHLYNSGYSSNVFVFQPGEQDGGASGANSLKGKIGVRYTNVGTYGDKTLDMKMVIVDWTSTRFGGKDGNIMIGRDRISLNTQSYAGVKVRYEFYEHGTDNPVEVAGFMTINDVDNQQYFQLDRSSTELIEKVYVSSRDNKVHYRDVNGESRFYDGEGRLVEPSDLNFTFTFLYNSSSSLTFTWGNIQCIPEEGGRDGMDPNGSGDGDIIGDYFGYIAKKPARTESANPVKRVSDNDEKNTLKNTVTTNGEILEYTITHNVADEYPEFYYKSYVFEDRLHEALEADSRSLTITNELGQNVTRYFDLDVGTDRVNYSAKASTLRNPAFYGHVYTTKFKAKLKDGYDPYDIGYKVTNQASITTDGDKKPSDTPETNYPKPPTTPSTIDKVFRTSSGTTKEVAAKIGDVLTIEIPVVVTNNRDKLSKLVISDQLQPGFEYVNRTYSIKEGKNDVPGTLNTANNNLVWTAANAKSLFSKSLLITFQVRVTKNANLVVGDGVASISNTAKIETDMDPIETPPIVAKVPVGSITVRKVNKDRELITQTNAADGATFQLYDAKTKQIAVDVKGNKVPDMLSGTTGITNTISNLLPGDYYLIETVAPKGYSLIASPIEFTIAEDNLNITLRVENRLSTQPNMPHSGSDEMQYNTLLIIVGLVIAAATGMLIVIRVKTRGGERNE